MNTLKLHTKKFIAGGEYYTMADYEYLELDIASKTGCIKNNFSEKKSLILQRGGYVDTLRFTQKEVNKLI